jgi:hypothetical protein
MKVHLAVINQPEKSTVLRYQPTSIETLIVQSTISQSCAANKDGIPPHVVS